MYKKKPLKKHTFSKSVRIIFFVTCDKKCTLEKRTLYKISKKSAVCDKMNFFIFGSEQDELYTNVQKVDFFQKCTFPWSTLLRKVHFYINRTSNKSALFVHEMCTFETSPLLHKLHFHQMCTFCQWVLLKLCRKPHFLQNSTLKTWDLKGFATRMLWWEPSSYQRCARAWYKVKERHFLRWCNSTFITKAWTSNNFWPLLLF